MLTFAVLISGDTQDDRSGDGAEDEPAVVQQVEHAEGSPADEQTQPPKHPQVSVYGNRRMSKVNAEDMLRFALSRKFSSIGVERLFVSKT